MGSLVPTSAESRPKASSAQAKWQCALEEMEVEEKVISKEEPLLYGGAEEHPGLDHPGLDHPGLDHPGLQHPGLEHPGFEQMAFWNWTRISEAKKEREEGGCGGLGSGVDLTFLIAVGCTVGIVCTLWILYRAYRLLFMTYCAAMSRQGDAGESGRAGLQLPSIYVIESLHPPHRKGTTPPPPYDSPPPYHVAVIMSQLPEVLVSDPVLI